MKNKEISLPRIIKLYKKKGCPQKKQKKTLKIILLGTQQLKKEVLIKKHQKNGPKRKHMEKINNNNLWI